MSIRFEDLTIKIFADGADIEGIRKMAGQSFISGFTTNPTLMRKAGVRDYEAFAREALEAVPDLPISFEVFSDEFDEMSRQARIVASWGPNVFVKIPVTNSAGERSDALLEELVADGVQVNVTALLDLAQVEWVTRVLAGGPASYISVFAGRIADTGRDPVPAMTEALEIMESAPNAELIWASPREVLNLVQADQIGCHVITMTNDLLAKVGQIGRSLENFSLETVTMFKTDAEAAGYTL